MKEQKITITIEKDGQIAADADGFSGDACLKDIEKLLDGLGAGVAKVERKPEAGTAQITQAKIQHIGRKK